jgi:hypothetical protein
MHADLVARNGKIATLDTRNTLAQALAVKFGRILAVGADQEIEALIGPETTVIDLAGRTVIPGLIDSHCHMGMAGAARVMYDDLSLEAGVRSIGDLQTRLARRAAKTPSGEWVYGYQEDDAKLAEKRHPTRWELDAAVPDHPALVTTVGGHFYIANSRALAQADVTRETPDPVGGKFDRDPATGELSGGLHEKALDVLRPGGPPEPSRQQARDGAEQMLKECAAAGLTCVYDTAGRPQIQAFLDLKNEGRLPIRVRLDVIIDLFPFLKALGIYRGLGDDMLRLCGLKFFFDGAISARTAAVFEPYLNQPGFYGVMATTPDIAREAIRTAYADGYRISSHANGDRAIALYLDIMEEVQSEFPRPDSRNRIIHCTVLNPDLVSRINKLKMLPTIFGPYVYYHGDKLIPAFGEKRLEWMFAARSLLDAGLIAAAHSDHPCAPHPPLMAVHGLVNRTTRDGRPIGASQRITVVEALRMYTTHAAYQSFDEHELGSLEPGKRADLVVLGQDILTVPAERILEIPIDMTLVDGRVVFERSA